MPNATNVFAPTNIEGLAFVGGYFRSKDDYLSLDYPTSILPNV